MKYLLAAAAILCMLLTAGCGHEPLSENSAEISATEETKSPTESIDDTDGVTDAAENDDISYIPENAAYKCTKYLVYDGEPEITEISYCDEFGNAIRIISYLDGELVGISDMENEYNSDGQAIRIKQSFKSIGEDSVNIETDSELEYNENGCIKKLTNDQNGKVIIMENEYEYDELGRPIVVMEYWNGSDELFSTTYKTYDENGNVIATKTNYKGKHEIEDYYQYDEKGRLLIEESNSFLTSLFEYEYEDYKDFTIKRPNGLTY